MLMAIKTELKLICLTFKYNIIKAIVNKPAFIINILSIILDNTILIIQWLILFSLKETIGGYKFNDTIMLLSLSECIYGVSNLFFRSAYNLHELVTNGKLDVYLTQPRNVLINIITSHIHLAAIGNLVSGYLLTILFNFSFKNILLFTIFSIMGGILMTSLAIILGSISFFTLRLNSVLDDLLDLAIMFSNYPEKIISTPIKIILYTFVPAGLLVYMPVSLIKNFNICSFLTLLTLIMFFVLSAFFLFYRGLKKYSSSSLITLRT